MWKVSFVCVCVFQLVPQWSPPCLCCLPLLCRSLENQPHCSACSALTLQRGRRWAGTLDGSEVTEGVQTSTESERNGRYSRSSVPEPQQSTLGRRRALRLQSNTWRSCSRAAVPQELRVLMFLQWRAAGFTAVTWFTAQYSSSLSICCHCCSFNKASERLTFVFDCIIDQCVLPSLKFQLRTAAFSSKCELKLLGFEHGLWRRSCSILRRSESLKLSMQIWFHLQLTVSLFDRFNVWTGTVSLLIM